MKYKSIELRRCKFSGLFFIESDLPFDHQDEGEYIGSAANAYIYEKSSSKEWKRKLVEQQIEMAVKDITRAKKLIEEMEQFKKKI
mgnify:CR=1 FL=1